MYCQESLPTQDQPDDTCSKCADMQQDTVIVSQQQADPAKAGKTEGVPATAEALAMPACSVQIARRQRKIVRRGNKQAQNFNRTAVAQ